MADITEYYPVPGVVGTDNVVPVYNPNARWCVWAKHELYMGGVGAKRYVPKVKDLVIDQDFWIWYEVIAIDPVTYVAVLREIDTRNTGGELTEMDILLGVGPGTQSDTYRIYIDQSVTPHTLAVDARLRVSGTMTHSCKIFKGADLTSEANVISKLYDASWNFLGTQIPLELVEMDGNLSTKVVPVCYTSENLADGELVTAVFYSDEGHVVSKRQLLVENTAFIREVDTSVKYITGISLKSPFISDTDPQLIQYPINVPLSGLYLTGVVHYSDGSAAELPVDGTKFHIFGFDNFVSTIIGQKLELVLKYTLSPDEVCYGATVTDEKFITQTYREIGRAHV